MARFLWAADKDKQFDALKLARNRELLKQTTSTIKGANLFHANVRAPARQHGKAKLSINLCPFGLLLVN
jgi:hypothetical protein